MEGWNKLDGKYQAFIYPKDARRNLCCLGVKQAMGPLDPNNPDHYRANSHREIIGHMKKLWNVKRIPRGTREVSKWEGTPK